MSGEMTVVTGYGAYFIAKYNQEYPEWRVWARINTAPEVRSAVPSKWWFENRLPERTLAIVSQYS